ncbi:MAG: hypothetical protein ACJ76H_12535, partial [Bacteriovoracaceae bacterium]
MKNLLPSTLLTVLFLLPGVGCATQELSREEHRAIVRELKKISDGGDHVRIVTNEDHEVPDPTRPLMVDLPNGEKKFAIGFSGQNIMLFDSLERFVKGGSFPVDKVDLLNKNGFPYGGEVDPATGRPFGYAFDSSTWDVAVFRYRDNNGTTKLKALAGAMADDENGRPLLIKDGFNNTRQRLFFDAEFVISDNKFHMVANNPKAPLNKGLPKDGNWIQRDENGKVIFSHGYGGEPITLQNGDLYIDDRGWVPFVHETVVQQMDVRDNDGVVHKIPYRTAIVVTYLDSTLSKIMAPAQIIFDVYRPDGQVWKAAERPTAGPLVEGPHLEVQVNGKAVESLAELRKLRKNKSSIGFQMLFSAGEYFGTYGSYMAYSEGDLHHMQPVTDDKGELLDLTAPLRVLFTWIGRPVSFHVGDKEYRTIQYSGGLLKKPLNFILVKSDGRIVTYVYYTKQEGYIVKVMKSGETDE